MQSPPRQFAGKLACLSRSFLQLTGTEPVESTAKPTQETDLSESCKLSVDEQHSVLVQVALFAQELEALDAATLLRSFRNSAHLHERVQDACLQLLALHRICCGVMLLDLRPAAALLLKCRAQMETGSRAVEATLVQTLTALHASQHYAKTMVHLDTVLQQRLRNSIRSLAI